MSAGKALETVERAHRPIGTHHCACGWQGDSFVTHIFDEVGVAEQGGQDDGERCRRCGRRYVRSVLVDVLVYHYRRNDSSCGCGWAELGRSHSEHVADIYEASVPHSGDTYG